MFVQRAARGPPPGGSGRGLLQSGSLAVLLAAAGPDEVEGVAVLDEVGVDRDGEARIVQLDREIVAAFAGALRPGGSDLDAADVDPMAGGVLADPVGLGDDTDALGLDAQGYDVALKLVAGLLEGADACHVTFSFAVRARDHRGLDGDLQAEGDQRRTRLRAGAQRRMAAVRLSWLARGMGEAQGKKVSPPPLRHRRSRRSRPLARSSHQRPRGSRRSDSTEEKTWRLSSNPHKRPPSSGEGKETLGCRWASLQVPTPGRAGPYGSCRAR